MNKKTINIVIIEPSFIIYEGFSSILSNTGTKFNCHHILNFNEFKKANLKYDIDFVLVNPNTIQNIVKEFNVTKNELNKIHWIAFLYTYIDQQILSLFDGVLNISDSPHKIISTLQMFLLNSNNKDDESIQENLSIREIDVLKLLVEGNANKEIASKLNISTNTVISHRKNISFKTGIKSVSGLTIYSIVNKIISIDSFND